MTLWTWLHLLVSDKNFTSLIELSSSTYDFRLHSCIRFIKFKKIIENILRGKYLKWYSYSKQRGEITEHIYPRLHLAAHNGNQLPWLKKMDVNFPLIIRSSGNRSPKLVPWLQEFSKFLAPSVLDSAIFRPWLSLSWTMYQDNQVWPAACNPDCRQKEGASRSESSAFPRTALSVCRWLHIAAREAGKCLVGRWSHVTMHKMWSSTNGNWEGQILGRWPAVILA